MPRGPGRFDRRIRPLKSTENTDIIPAITDPIDEAVTGEIPVPDAEVTGEIPPVPDIEPEDDIDDDIDDLLSDLTSPKADAETPDVAARPARGVARPGRSDRRIPVAAAGAPDRWCCWRGWRAKRGNGCLKPAAGCGRG